jgi:hypothetical protein
MANRARRLISRSSEKETLLTCTGQERQPVWSPDGTRIVWLSASSPLTALKVMNADGSSAETIASASGAPDDLMWGDPAWSSDNWIAFVVAQNSNSGTCFKTRLDKMRPDGSARTQVTDGGPNCTPAGMQQSGDADPGFSADGKTIYTSRGFPVAPAGATLGMTERKLYAVSSDAWYPGKPETDLSLPSQPSCIEGVPKGSPDGTRVLLFRACFDATPVNGIFVTDTASSYRTKITDGFGADWNSAAAPGPQINSGAVVIHAGVSPAVSPGSLVDIYGTNMAVASASAPAGANLPFTLGGVQVLVNSSTAPLLYVSAKQIIFQVPYQTNIGIASVVVVSNNSASGAEHPDLWRESRRGNQSGQHIERCRERSQTGQRAGALSHGLRTAGQSDCNRVRGATVAAVARSPDNHCFSRRRQRPSPIRRDGARFCWSGADELRGA